MKSSEQIAKAVYDNLAARDKQAVLSWRELGNDWCTSILNSGVLTPGRRISPAEAALAEERERLDEILLANQLRMLPPDETSRRREAAEHEAAHSIVAQSLGVPVRLAHVLADGSGECLHKCGTPFQTATIALAGEMWIGVFRSMEFPRGPVGCIPDRQTALTALPDHIEYSKARDQCFTILKENRAKVLMLADQIDRDGHAFI
ncbi:MAG: hypothetical protein ACRDTH_09090 [Pseudonocardiaceae bacterium]